MIQWRIFLAMLVITAIAGGLAGWAGVEYGLHREAREDLDTVLHRDLDLSAAQNQRIEALEKNFAVERTRYQTEMRAANRQLAQALTQSHSDGPEVERAIQRFHVAMAELQVRTVRHVLAMRAVLTAEQARAFDRTVTKTLTSDSP
jgi:Spy/CpxP family protein refolding chaperone